MNAACHLLLAHLIRTQYGNAHEPLLRAILQRTTSLSSMATMQVEERSKALPISIWATGKRLYREDRVSQKHSIAVRMDGKEKGFVI